MNILNLADFAQRASQLLNYVDTEMERHLAANYFNAVDDLPSFKSGARHIGMIAGLDQYNQAGRQPLHYAIERENVEAVDWLLEAGARPGGRTEIEAWNAAHLAVHYKQCFLLDRLTARDPEILIQRDNEQRTPLFLALQVDSTGDCVRELLRLQTPLEARFGAEKETYLHAAVRFASLPLFEVFLPAALALFEVKDGKGQSAVFLAAELGRIDILKALIRFGADLNVLDAQSNTIIHAAVQAGQFDALKLLLSGKVFIKQFPDVFVGEGAKKVRNSNGKIFTPPQIASFLTCFNAAQLTPLMCAVTSGHEGIVQLLAQTEREKHINLAQPASGNTALHLAVIGNRPSALEVVQALLQGRPRVSLANAEGKTALLIAEAQGMTEVVSEIEPFEDF